METVLNILIVVSILVSIWLCIKKEKSISTSTPEELQKEINKDNRRLYVAFILFAFLIVWLISFS